MLQQCPGKVFMTFWFRSFFAPFFKISWVKKWPDPKKVVKIKNQFFSCSSTTWKNFWNLFILRPYFHNCLPELLAHWPGTFTSRLFDLISSFWHDILKNHVAGWIRDNRSHPTEYTCTSFFKQLGAFFKVEK